MGLLIGMDEAGYGPNLGPLVVTATAWETPGDPRDVNLFEAFDDVVGQKHARDGSRLHVADSKAVFSPSRGIRDLEWGVLSTLGLLDQSPATLNELWDFVSPATAADRGQEPWFKDETLDLPTTVTEQALRTITDRWRDCCLRQGIVLKAVRSDIVLTERFNRLVEQTDSKGVVLSQISLNLLTEVWDPDTPTPTWIIADKHGGRNRYTSLLLDALDGRMVFELQQGRNKSCYRVGKTVIRFQMKAEAHFPVAIASMISKYVRELTMMQFNRFWQQHLPDLKPTAGYPVDARRFKQDIAESQSALGIDDRVLWRLR